MQLHMHELSENPAKFYQVVTDVQVGQRSYSLCLAKYNPVETQLIPPYEKKKTLLRHIHLCMCKTNCQIFQEHSTHSIKRLGPIWKSRHAHAHCTTPQTETPIHKPYKYSLRNERIR